MRRLSKLLLCLTLLFGPAITPLWAQEVKIPVLGDSLVQGYGLAPEAGFVPQLQAAAAAAGLEVSFVNAGVSGDTSAGGRARIEWTLADGADALVVSLGGNDVLRGIAPEETRANLAAILDAASARDLPVLLVGIAAPGNYGAAYQKAFQAVYADLAAQYGALLYPDFMAALAALSDRGQVLNDYMQPDGIHPNSEGVKLIVAAIWPSVAELATRAAAR